MTFLVTDIEDSTAMWDLDADSMAIALARHDDIIGEAVTAAGGTVIKSKGEGDATLSVFQRASEAVAAALALQNQLAHELWPGGLTLRVRIALHTGESTERNADYFGPTVNRAARIRALARGGQTLLSQATLELVHDRLPAGVSAADLGEHRLRGVSRPERVFDLCVNTRGATPKKRGTAKKSDTALPGVVRVLLADDHPLWRRTLRELLDHGGFAKVVGEAGSGDEAVLRSRELEPQVIVMDVDMPGRNGIEAARAVTQAQPDVKVLMLSSLKDRDEVIAAVRAGASGYLLKTTGPDEVTDAIRRVNAGEVVFPPELSSLVLAELRGASRGGEETKFGIDALTKREHDVLALMADGKSNQAISKSLHLSPKTIEAHIASIFTKLGLETEADQNRRVQAVIAYLGQRRPVAQG